MSEPLTHRRRKEVASLIQKKYRERLGQTLIEGRRSVGSALDAEVPLLDLLIADSVVNDAEIQRLMARTSAPVHIVPDEELDAISAVETTQGVLGVVAIRTVSVDTLTSATRILVLDGLQDPGNAGTLLRTAAWFGVDAVVTAPGTVDLYHPKVVRATMGAIWDLAHTHVDDLAGMLGMLRQKGFRIYGADLKGTDVRAWNPYPRSVLVLGSEGHGISTPVSAVIDERVAIPGSSTGEATESLNVAIAAGIILYEWQRCRT